MTQQVDLEKWIVKVRKSMEKIKDLKPKDRLEKVKDILECNGSIASSVNGWMFWLVSPPIMEKFDEKELDDILKRFQEIAVKFLETDLEYSEKFIKEKKMKKKDSEEENKTPYIR